MNVLAWNLNNRVRDAPAQWECVRRYAADFVALSEVPGSQVPVWAGRLSEGGYDAVWTFGQ